MAQCAYCTVETEIYEGGDVPICVECLDNRKVKRKSPATQARVAFVPIDLKRSG
jgi:hypothetical protein